MYPILFEIFGITVHAYGFMISLGFLAALGFARFLGPQRGIPREKIPFMAIWLLIWGAVGARWVYIVVDLDYYLRHPLEIIMIWRGGLVFYGALLFPFLYCLYFAKANRISFLNLMDVLFPCAMLCLFFGRWGCFLVGDCYGCPASPSLPWAVRFPFREGSLIPVELLDVPLHPVQIYSSLNALLIFFITLYILKKRRFEGQPFLAGLTLYGVLRGLLEFYRGDDQLRGFWGPLSTSQWLSVGVLCTAPVLYLVLRRRADKSIQD